MPGFLRFSFAKLFVFGVMAAGCLATYAVPGNCQSKPASGTNAAGAANHAPITDKWALVVGVSKFQDPTIPQLRYAAKDAKDFADFLVKKANFAPDHVRVLTNEQATQRRILSEIGDKFLPRVVRKDDLVVIFYSSHGSPANKDVAHANFLVAYDTEKSNLYATGIEMQNLTWILRDRVRAERILIVMDACHSGGGADGAKDAEEPSSINLKEVNLGSGQMILSSSAENERSWESKHYPNGVFTHHLMSAMEKDGPAGGLSKVFQDMEAAVEDEVRTEQGVSQTPKLRRDMWKGNDLLLAAPPLKPQPMPEEVKKLLASYGSSAVPAPANPADPAKITAAHSAIRPTIAKSDPVVSAAETLSVPESQPTAPAAPQYKPAVSWQNLQARHPQDNSLIASAASPGAHNISAASPSSAGVSALGAGMGFSKFIAPDGSFSVDMPLPVVPVSMPGQGMMLTTFESQTALGAFQVMVKEFSYPMTEQTLGFDFAMYCRDNRFARCRFSTAVEGNIDGHIVHSSNINASAIGRQGKVVMCASGNKLIYFLASIPNPGKSEYLDAFFNSIHLR